MLKAGSLALVISGAIVLASPDRLAAKDCAGKQQALNTSRTIAVNPVAFPLVGKQQYMETFRLKDREVILTFDDGPVTVNTPKILDALAAECVKATFFMLGANVAQSPHLVRRAYDEGHSIGTHTFSHPNLSQIPFAKAQQDIALGIDAVTEALGKSRQLAPFFRAPYLGVTKELEKFLHSRGLMVWSIDADSQDWTFTTPDKVVEQSIADLEKVGKGMLLLHDIKPATARALPLLLAELRRRDYRVVHVVPANQSPNSAGLTR